MSLINQIKTTRFSPGEQEIADYILQNKDQIADMTITDLAKKTYSSNAAIIRFCKRMGLKGYKDFRLRFIQEIEKDQGNNIYVDFNYPFDSSDRTSDIMRKMANLYTKTINNNYASLAAKELDAMARIMDEADQIYLFALGDSEIRGQSFANKMLKLGRHVIDTNRVGDSLSYASYATNKDCALFISYSGASHKEALPYLQRNDATILAITAKPDSPVARAAKKKIIIDDLEKNNDSIGTFYSQISFDYILNVLYSIIYALHYAKNHVQKNDIFKSR